MTGKLSDFTGLLSFCVLALIIWPHGRVLLGVALSFAFWKSPFSQPLITSWNTLTGCLINRTIDYTDLLALSMIPAAWIFFESAKAGTHQNGMEGGELLRLSICLCGNITSFSRATRRLCCRSYGIQIYRAPANVQFAIYSQGIVSTN